MSVTTATHVSGVVRFDRAVTRAFVKRGGALTPLLRDRSHYELDGVTVAKLVQWVPGIGVGKASRILLGLPHHLRLRDLDAEQYHALVERLADAERNLITRRLEKP